MTDMDARVSLERLDVDNYATWSESVWCYIMRLRSALTYSHTHYGPVAVAPPDPL